MKNQPLSVTIVISPSVARSIGLVVLLALLGLSVGRAYAGSCFTDTGGHWAESFICWMKTVGLSSGYPDGTFRPDNPITRAEVGALLYKEASGDSYVNIGPGDWQVDASSYGNGSIAYFSNRARLNSLTTGLNHYHISVPLITALHNQQMTVKGAELCYSANVTLGGEIDQVAVEVFSGIGTLVQETHDYTTRSDYTCREYNFTTPVVLTSTDSLVVYVTTNLVATSDYVYVYSATAIQGFNPAGAVLAPAPSIVGPLPGEAP